MRAAEAAKAHGLVEVHKWIMETRLASVIGRFDDAIAQEDIEAARVFRALLWRGVLELIAANQTEPRGLATWALMIDTIVGALKKKLRAEGKPF